jgi:RNA polymerase sigma factor (TIGR02999 family)
MDEPVGPLVQTADGGDPEAVGALFAALYRELHAIAERDLRRGGSDLTLGTTTLLHEAYLNLASREDIRFANRAHFLAYASRAMRGLVVDFARRRGARKRGRQLEVTLVDDARPSPDAECASEELRQLSDALEELAALEPSLAELVDLHFFCGFSFAEIAALRGVSDRTVQRDWRKARLLLHRTLLDGPGPAADA